MVSGGLGVAYEYWCGCDELMISLTVMNIYP